MSDAIHIEQRLHALEQRLHDLVTGWGSRRSDRRSKSEQSPREMEQQAVERLFANHRRETPPSLAPDFASAREMERVAMRHLYGDRPTVVVQALREPGDD